MAYTPEQRRRKSEWMGRYRRAYTAQINARRRLHTVPAVEGADG